MFPSEAECLWLYRGYVGVLVHTQYKIVPEISLNPKHWEREGAGLVACIQASPPPRKKKIVQRRRRMARVSSAREVGGCGKG